MRRVRATQDEEEGDPDYEDENEDEPIEPVRRCTYSQCNKGCFNEESLWRHVSIAIRVLCTAPVFKTADALRSSEHTTLRGYATQLSVLRACATQLSVLRVPARRVLCTALLCKTFDALRSSEHTTLRGYATQLSALRVHATQLIFHCHMHREGRDHSSNAEAVDVQLVDAQAVVEQGRKVGVVVRKFSNGFIIKTIVFHPRIRIPRIPGISLMLRGLLQRETETNEGFFIKNTDVSLKILKFNDTTIFY